MRSHLVRFDTIGNVTVGSFSQALQVVDRAYDGLVAFENTFEVSHRSSNDVRSTRSDVRRQLRLAHQYSATPWVLVPRHDELLLQTCVLRSPGFLEVFGKLNPLEVLRQYVRDRHERQKDRSYRNKAEADRLQLENMLLENQLVSERLNLIREYVPDAQLSPLLEAWIARPLEAVGTQVDAGLMLPAGTVESDAADA